MAKTFEFNECSIKNDLSASLREKYCMMIPDKMLDGLYRCIFRSFALICRYYQTKDRHNIGFALKDERGKFVIGTIMTYEAPADEEADDEGHYALSMTFNENDLEGVDTLLDNYMDSYPTVLQTELYTALSTHCADNKDLFRITVELIEGIKKFLDANSNDTSEDVELTLPSIFTAGVSIESGEKVFSIVPGYSIKQVIKNDDATEKEAA